MRKTLIVFVLLLAILAILFYRPSVSISSLMAKYPSDRAGFMEMNGMDVHYRQQGSGMPLLLIHGTSSSLHTWEKWAQILSDHFKVISIDMPGGGLTGPHPEEDYSIETYLSFIDTFCVYKGLDSIYIAGNSLGGKTAWKYAAQSERVKKMILVDPSGFHKADRETPKIMKMAEKNTLSNLSEHVNIKYFIRQSLKEVYFNDSKVTNGLVSRYNDFLRVKGNRLAFFQKIQSTKSSDPAELQAIQCPTLIQWGEHDEWIDVSMADIFKENIPNNELIIYGNCGHVPQEELPELTAYDALAFLLK